MTRRHLHWFAVPFVLAAMMLHPAKADVIISQPGIVLGPGLGSSGSIVGYDDFRLSTTATVTRVSWVGEIFTPQTFIVSFTTDAGVGSQFPNLTPFASETVAPTATPYDPIPIDMLFTATLPTPVTLPGGTDLWISIYDPSNDFDAFEWIAATDAPSPGALDPGTAVDDVNGNPITIALDLSFTLYSDATAVPEPGSLALLGGSLGMMWLVRRRRARR